MKDTSDLYFCNDCWWYFDIWDGEHINNVFTCHKCYHEKENKTTSKDFVLLCIDNEIYRYRKMEIKEWRNISTFEISVLQEFRQNIVDNC